MASIQSIGINYENDNVGDSNEVQFQKDKEERIRAFREHQEVERLKKLKGLEEQFIMSKRHREHQEEIRRRKIEEARAKEIERRHQVEERKRQIWEAEQERKEAILRRNMEREMRIEARRNAQRNSQCFAFGSSTPRTFDLDLAAIGTGRNFNQGSVLMSSVSGRRSEERDLGPPRATSACSLDRKIGDSPMSRSMVSLSSTFRGRKRTDLMPIFTRERSTTPHITPRGNQSIRAVSMTRLDQLAQPRRTNPINHVSLTSIANAGPKTTSSSISKSMCNLANSHVKSNKRMQGPTSNNGMSQSMLHLAENTPQKDNHCLNQLLSQPKSRMRSAQSMMHLIPTPRLTRAARLRTQASAWNISKNDSHYLSPDKDASRSPSRPQSSMSGNSEISATSSSVSMRVHPVHRRPRPFSIAGCISDSSLSTKKESEQKPRLEKQDSVPTQKLNRTKSANIEKVSGKNLLRKPVPPPKSSEVLAKAKSQSVHTKDNLRKVSKSTVSKSFEESKFSGENKESAKSTEHTNCRKKDVIKANSDKERNPSLVSLTSGLEDSLNCENSKATIGEVNNSTLCEFTIEANDKIEITNNFKSSNVQVVIPPKQAITDNEHLQRRPAENAKKIDLAENSASSPCDNNNDSETVNKETMSKHRITSEEEAKTALAEKRRLAREQAEKEAELNRQRTEELRQKEEEKRKFEEAELKRIEEEQIRLAKLHSQLEEEKLRKAIHEREQREREEQEKREEEARQKTEREEQEKKAREEAEKQRIELEEKLRKEEEERAERKRRVEQIMARTRGKTTQSPSVSLNESNVKPVKSNEKYTAVTTENIITGISSLSVSEYSISNNEKVPRESENGISHMSSNWSSDMQPLPDLLNLDNIPNIPVKANGQYAESTAFSSEVCISSSFPVLPTNTLVTTSPQSNGYSSHEDMSCTTSPEENTSTEFLVDIQSCVQPKSPIVSTSTDFSKLVELESPSVGSNIDNQNFLINVDSINSNLLNSTNPFAGFDDSLQNTSMKDLLS